MHPSSSLATLRPDLAGSLEEFNLEMDRQGFIGLRVLPVMEVGLAADTFGKIPVESLLKLPDTKRGPKGEYNRIEMDFTDDSYATVENGIEGVIDENLARMYAAYFDAEQVMTKRVRDVILRKQEERAAALVFNATTWTGSPLTTAVSVKWTPTYHATATPITDVLAAKQKVWDGCGHWPNALILNRKKFNDLRQLDQITDMVAVIAGSSTRTADINKQILAACFDVEEVLVAGAAVDSAVEGQSTVFGQLWSSSYAMLAVLCRTNDIAEPGLGRTFHWGADGSLIGGLVESYPWAPSRGDVVRCRQQTHEKILYTECAHLLSNVN